MADNGSEFMKHFDQSIRQSCKDHWHTHPKTPKMNAHCERFNRTIQEEYIDYHLTELLNPASFNEKLADWLMWYNVTRPHHSLKLKSPVQFLQSHYRECNLWWPNTAAMQNPTPILSYRGETSHQPRALGEITFYSLIHKTL